MPIFENMHQQNDLTRKIISTDDQYSETTLTGLNIFLMILSHSNVNFCSHASIRIRSLLDYRPIQRREEAAYLLSTINRILSSISSKDDFDRHTSLLNMLNYIIDQSFDLLQINQKLPSIDHDSYRKILDTFQELVTTSLNCSWNEFIRDLTEPYAEHYRSMTIRPFHMNMKIWQNECHEMMTIGVHRRNRKIELEKKKFQVRNF